MMRWARATAARPDDPPSPMPSLQCCRLSLDYKDSTCAERAIEVEGGADQSKVGERLREVAQGLAAVAGLFAVQTEVIRVAEHLLKEQPRVVEPGRVRAPGAGECFDQPERAHVERSLAGREPVCGVRAVIAVDEPVCAQTPRGEGPPERIQRAQHARAVRGHA